MLTLRRYWNVVQEQLGEKEVYSPDEMEMWIHNYKYTQDFLDIQQRCRSKLHTLPGCDEIALGYMDIGNVLGCAYPIQKLIILNPFHCLAMPFFITQYILPHEYVHIMLGEEHNGHDDEFFNYFEAVTNLKHPPQSQMISRNECKYSLEVQRSFKT